MKITTEKQLMEIITQIHSGCHKLCKQAFDQYYEVSGNMGVFCHDDDEYELLTQLRKDLTEPSDNPNQKYFKLIEPIVVNATNGFPKATYTHLYIRQPDPTPYGEHSGDVDFVLEPGEYDQLKASITENSKDGIQMYDRPGWDTIQITDPNIDAIAYVSTLEMAKKARVKFV